MKNRKQIEEEIKSRKEKLKTETNYTSLRIHKTVINTLMWVLNNSSPLKSQPKRRRSEVELYDMPNLNFNMWEKL